MKQKGFNRIVMATVVLSASLCAAQANDANYWATFDDKGNVYVASDDGKRIRMAGTDHCAETIVAVDRQTVGCLVAMNAQNRGLRVPAPSLQLEIYLKGGQRSTIEPGAPIREWHFFGNGQQVAVYSGGPAELGRYTLYESATSRLLKELASPTNENALPEWAKSRSRIDDDSVPMSPDLAAERTRWVAKTLREIREVKPGMQRKDLFPILKTEGGLSNQFHRTYVFAECPFIKVDVEFKAAHRKDEPIREESPLDVIESVSVPYLQWTVAD